MADWGDFAVAMAGVSGALAGLLIVAISVNIDVIVGSRTLPARAGASIATLVLATVAACLLLVPGTVGWVFGIEVLAGSALVWAFQVHAIRRVATTRQPESRSPGVVIATSLLPVLAFTIGGVLLVAGIGAGMLAVVAGCVLAIASAVLVSWVTLVEVRR